MALIVGLGLAGLRQIAQRRYETHRRLMLASAWLVVAFVLSYGVKLLTLGREALETWEPSYVHMLRLHELCVAAMVLGGALAIWKALQLGLPRDRGEPPARRHPHPVSQVSRGIRLHRRAGFIALGSASFGLLTAAYVLFGMWSR